MSLSYGKAWLDTLQSEYEINAKVRWPHVVDKPYPPQATILSEHGADFMPINGHASVRGHELVRRIDLAIKRRDALDKAIQHTTALLAERMQELMEGERS